MKDITPFEIIMSLFFVFAWSRAFLRFTERHISFRALLFWTAVWGFAFYFLFLPNKADLLAHLLGVKRGTDALFSIAIAVIFYFLYRIYSGLEHLERKINLLVQKSSLKLSQVEKPKRRTSSKGK